MGRGALLEAEGRCREALPDYLAAAAIDNTFAELEYRRARCAYAQGDYGIAAAGYARARDLDTLRFRADTRIDRIIREVAGEPGAGVTFIDGAAALAQASDHGVIDGALFYEHAHLTPAGNYQLAKALFPAVAAALPPALRGPGEPPAPLAEPEAHARLALTGFDRYRVAKEVLDRLSRPPFTQQLDHQAQLVELAAERDRGAAEAFAESDARYRAAIAQAPDDPWLRLGHGILLDTRDVFLARRGGQDQGAALAPYQKALELLPNLTPARFRLAEALLRLGRPNEAVAQCQALLAARPGHAPAYKTMGLALSRMEKPAEALAAWQRALALDPSTSGEALVEIGRLQLGLHRASEAAQSFRRALADGQGGGELQLQLGAALRAAGRSGEARQALGEAARSFRAEQKADPASAKAHTGLANTLVEQGDLAGAAEEFARAASLQPEDPAPRWSLVGVLALAGRREEAARTARAAAQALRALGRAADAETFEAREREIEAGRR